ncbi:TasA family protein [Lentibacillus jeotgali]|uniref:TasA family protein n=1 Tax=Lentibacillus jeotgali TaxID=558169 RepID=UPI003CCACBBC
MAGIGISLITGGTSAYFTDAASTDNTITTGSLDLGLNKEPIFQVEGLMPGGTQETQFKLINEGSMNIESITLNTSYDIVDKGEPNNR